MPSQPKKYKALYALIIQKGYDFVSFSKAVGISRSTLYRAFAGSNEFNLGDVRRMMKLLGIVDPRPFFFEDCEEIRMDAINAFSTDSKPETVENPDKRKENRRFHCTNTGGFCDQVKDESECDHCGFCIIEQLRRKRIRPSLCDDGLMRIQIKRTVTKHNA